MKFSIVIPVFNVAPYVGDCINSILTQSCVDWECIFVDDGSTDDSATIIQQATKRADIAGKRILLLRQENRGVCVARQRGLELATGEWVVFIDPDDWLDDDYLAIMARKIDSGNYDIIWSGYKKNSNSNEEVFFQDGAEDIMAHAQAIMADRILGTVWGRAFRHRFLLENEISFNNPDLHYQEDLCFVSECLRCRPIIGYARGCAYHYRQRPLSAMRGVAVNDVRALIYIQKHLDVNLCGLGCDQILLMRRKWTKLAACKHLFSFGLREFSRLFPEITSIADLPVNIFVKLAFNILVKVLSFIDC